MPGQLRATAPSLVLAGFRARLSEPDPAVQAALREQRAGEPPIRPSSCPPARLGRRTAA